MKAIDKLVRARTALIVSNPFYGCLALHLEVVEAPWCGTMATDGRYLLYAPDFVHSISEEELIGVCAHEVSHCSYRHMTRRGNREPSKWNVAADFIVNIDLREAGFVLPECALYDLQYKGMSTEEVYALLPDPPPNSGGGGNEEGPGGRQNHDPGKCGGVLDAAGPNDAQGQAMDQMWEAITRQAVAVARAQAGKLPAHLERLVTTLNAPRVDWRDLTRRFIDDSARRDYSWVRPNKRFLGSQFVLPGYVPDALNHLVMYCDTSGSIWGDEALLQEFANEIAAVLDEGVADKVTVVYADTMVQRVETFETGDLFKLNAKGGGGTNFRTTFDWIKENVPDASAVVCLTDGYTEDWGDDPGMPTLWGIYGDSRQFDHLANLAPFGEAIRVAA